MDVHEIITKKLKANWTQRNSGFYHRIAEDAQQILVLHRASAFEKVVKVNEVVEHEILVNYVWPIFVNDPLDDPWTQH